MSAPAPSSSATLTLLGAAHPPALAATIHATKLHRKPLYLHPTLSSSTSTSTTTAATDARALRRAARTPPTPPTSTNRKPLTARQKRALQIHALPRRLCYSTFVPLHSLWVSYMHEVLGPHCAGQGQAQIGAKLASADYHGAVLEVVRSRCVDRVGKRGVCVKETRSMFVLVTEGGRVLEIPKEHTVFRFELPLPGESGTASTTSTPTTTTAASTAITTDAGPSTAPAPPKPKCMVFELHGQQFMYRSAERVGKKFKSHSLADL